jgi:hypothetical protein
MFLLSASIADMQAQLPSIGDFCKEFRKIELPTEIRFVDTEFNVEYYKSDASGKAKENKPYRDHVLDIDSTKLLNFPLCIQYFFSKNEKTVLQNTTSSQEVSRFIPIGLFSTNSNFSIFIFQTQYTFNDMLQNEKYLCTVSKQGEYIDKLLLASANYAGTSLIANDFRVPWFPDVYSNISSDLTVDFIDANQAHKKYKITVDGKIVLQ